MGQLTGKTAIVTGAGTGIGRSIAKRFHQEGAFVVLAGRRADKLEESAAIIAEDGGRVLAVSTDITDEAQIKALLEKTAQTAGNPDILVNNAGVMRFASLSETPLEEWDLMMRTNTYAPWRLMVNAAPFMLKQGGGSIINISSIAGIKSFPGAGVYCASKAAMQVLSQVMAMEFAAEQIRVNCILPALVEDTELAWPIMGKENIPEFYEGLRTLHPMQRNGKPKDIADAALFFASEQSSWITGTLLSVDGGRHMATNRPNAD